MKTKQTAWYRLLAAVLAFSLVAAACGSDDEAATDASTESTGTDSDTDSAESDAEDTGGGDDADTEDNSDAGNGDAEGGDDQLDPVTISLIVQDEELISTPEVRAVSEAYAAYFNAELDGVNGHEIVLDICGAGDAPEGHIACAQEFVNKEATIVIASSFGANSAAVSEILVPAGIPVLTLGNDFGDYFVPGQYVFSAGTPGVIMTFFEYMGSIRGESTATFFIADDPEFEAFVDPVVAIASIYGVDVNESVKLGFEPDLTGPISAANPDNDGWIFVLADGAQCTAAANSIGNIDYEGSLYATDICITPDLVESGLVNGWAAPFESEAAATNIEEFDEIARILEEYGNDQAVPTGIGGWALAQLWIARDVIIEGGAGDATAESVNAALSTYASSDIPGFPDTVECPGPTAWVGACQENAVILEIQDGELISPSGFVDIDFSDLDFLFEE